jgi:hypothetical protein
VSPRTFGDLLTAVSHDGFCTYCRREVMVRRASPFADICEPCIAPRRNSFLPGVAWRRQQQRRFEERREQLDRRAAVDAEIVQPLLTLEES